MDTYNEFPYNYILESTDKISSDYLVETFKSMILSDKFPVGYALPNENTLCEKLGISRTTLREAFKVLAAYGLITRTKHGTFINDSKNFSSSLKMDYHFEESDSRELLEFRKMLETESAYMAAQNATTDDIRELKRILINQENCKNSPSALSYNDTAFHMMIAQCTHNKLLMGIMQLISDSYYKNIRKQFETIDNIEGKTPYNSVFVYHNKIFDAILLKDPQAAANAMRKHINSILTAVEELEQKNNRD